MRQASSPPTSLEDFFSFLDKRKGLLDGVCVTGGEPLLQPGLADFCAHVRERGFAVKLDTNGSFPDRLRALVSQGLVDYVAMDVKNAPERYEETVGVDGLDLARVRESVSFLLEGSVPYEFRTTVVRELHAESDLRSLAEWIAGAEAWFLGRVSSTRKACWEAPDDSMPGNPTSCATSCPSCSASSPRRP